MNTKVAEVATGVLFHSLNALANVLEGVHYVLVRAQRALQ